ncbi:MAG: NUDIX hydrolase [Gammaproteobacteria bacterium]|nr:NUDIX hydrolase [Gammaproteobacteria bacterium]
MQWKPNVTVAAVVENNGKFLLVEEYTDDELVYNQPAGHLEENETLIEAVKREVKEETARDFEPDSLIGVYMYPNRDHSITYLRFCFHGHCTGHDPEQALDDGIIRAVWLSREELESQEEKLRSGMVIQCIDDYLSGKSFPLDLLHHQLIRN